MTTRILVTGGAGFIGSNLVDRLLAEGNPVTVLDNFSTGFREFLAGAARDPGFRLVEGDLQDRAAIDSALQDCEFVFHLAANADVRSGLAAPWRDLEQNTIATYNLLEAMRHSGARRIAFSSTGSIYGEPKVFPTPEDAPFPVQTSLYGASKLACEGLIQAYCEGYGFQSWIFRFVSILGARYSHGHVFDFCRQLLQDPTRLKVLGDGHQRKSYLAIQDCIAAMLLAVRQDSGKVSIYNLGTPRWCEVDDSVRCITEAMGISPQVEHSGGVRGWIGDSPMVLLDLTRIMALGWKPSRSIEAAVAETVAYLLGNQWLFDRRT